MLTKSKQKNKRNGLLIAGDVLDSSIMNYVTEKGFFLDGQGKSYMQTGGSFYDAGDYNPDIHGLPVPLAKGKDSSPFTTPRLQDQLKIKQFQNNADKVFKRDKPEKA